MGFIIYNANTLQLNLLIKNVLAMIKQEIGPDKEVAIQLEVDFLANVYKNISVILMTDKMENR